MSWDRLLGQGVAKRILQNQLRVGQLSHAYLFTGPLQAEKGLAAMLLAQAVNCTAEVKPCGICTSCRQIEQGVHSDVRRISPDGSSIKLQQVKNLLTEAVLTPNIGPYRVFIIEEAQALTREAANSLLLMLEEPPKFDLFILTASAPVLPTIESRCQILHLQRATPATGIGRADYDWQADPECGVQQASCCAQARQLLGELIKTPLMERAKLVDELEKTEVDLAGLLAALLSLYRDFAVREITGSLDLVKDRESVELLYPAIAKQSNSLIANCQAILDVQRRLSNNVNKRLALEYLVYNL